MGKSQKVKFLFLQGNYGNTLITYTSGAPNLLENLRGFYF